MIVPFVARAALVVNMRMTATLALAATRSPAAMVNVTAVFWPIAENATPRTWSMTAGVAVPSKVVIETVLAGWAVAAFVSPATGHEMAVDDDAANAVVKLITRIAPLHVTVAAPAVVAPPKVQVAELVTADVTKLVPATVIVLIVADVAGVKATMAVTFVAAETMVDNVTEAVYIDGNVPAAVVSRTTGLPADKSLEVPAAMLDKAACPSVGLVNLVMVKVMAVSALKVPAVSFTVNLELANAAEQEAPAGAVTAQALAAPAVVSKAMPAPDSVMMMPELAPVMACVGVNKTVTVVAEALT